MPGLEVLAWSLDTDLNYCLIYSEDVFEFFVMLCNPFIILCSREEQKISTPRVSGRVEIRNFQVALLPGSPSGLCPGPAGGSHHPQTPSYNLTSLQHLKKLSIDLYSSILFTMNILEKNDQKISAKLFSLAIMSE